MAYEQIESSANPRLLVLLTDESEESAKLVNRIVSYEVGIHFDGCKPKNRLFIAIIGLFNTVRVIKAGFLDEFDNSTLRLETVKKKISDGAGGLITIDVTMPIWVEPITEDGATNMKGALKIAREIIEMWINDKPRTPAPIVIDCSEKNQTEEALPEIEALKQLSTLDGKTLFFGCYWEVKESTASAFSNIPVEWTWKFENMGLPDEKYRNGIFEKDIDLVLSAIAMY